MTDLTLGDIAIVGYSTSTDSFSFVLARDIDAGTVINFTDNGWQTGVGLRSSEGTVSYTAPSAIAAARKPRTGSPHASCRHERRRHDAGGVPRGPAEANAGRDRPFFS